MAAASGQDGVAALMRSVFHGSTWVLTTSALGRKQQLGRLNSGRSLRLEAVHCGPTAWMPGDGEPSTALREGP